MPIKPLLYPELEDSIILAGEHSNHTNARKLNAGKHLSEFHKTAQTRCHFMLVEVVHTTAESPARATNVIEQCSCSHDPQVTDGLEAPK